MPTSEAANLASARRDANFPGGRGVKLNERATFVDSCWGLAGDSAEPPQPARWVETTPRTSGAGAYMT